MTFDIAKTMISERDAKQRINLALKPYLHGLKTIHGSEYYIVDHCRNLISYHDVDLESFGQELGVIKSWETVDMSGKGKIAGYNWCSLLAYSPTRRSYFSDRVVMGNHHPQAIDRRVIERLRELLAKGRS
jgi:hypothetical protein